MDYQRVVELEAELEKLRQENDDLKNRGRKIPVVVAGNDKNVTHADGSVTVIPTVTIKHLKKGPSAEWTQTEVETILSLSTELQERFTTVV